jgi:hypothetical protein
VRRGGEEERAQEGRREQPHGDRERVLAGEVFRQQRRGDRDDPVPMTEPNQFGPMCAKASAGESSARSIRRGRRVGRIRWSAAGCVDMASSCRARFRPTSRISPASFPFRQRPAALGAHQERVIDRHQSRKSFFGHSYTPPIWP